METQLNSLNGLKSHSGFNMKDILSMAAVPPPPSSTTVDSLSSHMPTSHIPPHHLHHQHHPHHHHISSKPQSVSPVNIAPSDPSSGAPPPPAPAPLDPSTADVLGSSAVTDLGGSTAPITSQSAGTYYDQDNPYTRWLEANNVNMQYNGKKNILIVNCRIEI